MGGHRLPGSSPHSMSGLCRGYAGPPSLSQGGKYLKAFPTLELPTCAVTWGLRCKRIRFNFSLCPILLDLSSHMEKVLSSKPPVYEISEPQGLFPRKPS